ncbi:AsmA family protein [Methyloligella sp. 2.7D]|uniref:AsmA family protein n=1 Tax=unclassified Methyloligella TaxID=2625955 RepID=UPI00157E05A2|nr:AsmA family protein [Methyloligella sp. GL2]QKP77972.1 AsmA family protein [Methyloligella sp. GL2]
MNSFLLTLAALLILALSALFAIPYFVDFNDYRPVLEAQATKLLGRTVKVEGPVHLELLPVPELRFDEVSVADRNGDLAQPFLKTQSIEATLNIGALMRGAIEAQTLNITAPVLRLNIGADGIGNWEDIGAGAEQLRFGPRRIAFDAVTVTGGRIEIAREGEEALILDKVQGQASAGSLQGPYKVALTYETGGKPQELRFSTGAAGEAGSFRLKSTLRDLQTDTAVLLDGVVSGLGDRPRYEGNLTARRVPQQGASQSGAMPAVEAPEAPGSGNGTSANGAAGKVIDLKGELVADLASARLDPFTLSIHSGGRSQTMKGKLALDYAGPLTARGEIAARWVDLDSLLLAKKGQAAPTPAVALGKLLGVVFGEAGRFQSADLDVKIEQASLGGDLVTGVDLALASQQDGSLRLDHLTAGLPGESRIEAQGVIARAEGASSFTGKMKLSGKKLATVTRWAIGERGFAGPVASEGFSVAADAQIAADDIQLSAIKGEVSGTGFGGALRFHSGDKRVLYLTLDSNRLDLRDVMGEGGVWQVLSGGGAKKQGATPAKNAGPFSLAAFRNDEAHISLQVGELLMPDTPGGALEANFNYAGDRLDISRLDFAAPGAVALQGKGHIDALSEQPVGEVRFSLNGQKPESVMALATLLGLPEQLSTNYLPAMAPMDLNIALSATREGEASRASADISGTAKGADVALRATLLGDVEDLQAADLDVDGTIDGADSKMLISLLVPSLSAEEVDRRFARAAKGVGSSASETPNTSRLQIALKGVPEKSVTGSLSLRGPVSARFEGTGSLKESQLFLDGKLRTRTGNAGLLVALAGFELPPSAEGLSADLAATVKKTADELHFAPIEGTLGGQPVSGKAHVLFRDQGTEIFLDADTETASLPGLLGLLIAWERTASTEEMLGTVIAGKADVWPVRGFALDSLAGLNAHLNLHSKTLSMGSAFPLQSAQFKADASAGGLTISALKGKLFGGIFAASGKLTPRGQGVHLDARAELAAAKLSEATTAIAGEPLAKSVFGVNMTVSGEGLSPPGLVAGLSGKGMITFRPGEILSFDPAALQRMIAGAARTDQNKVNEEKVGALAETLRAELKQGGFHFRATSLKFEIANGVLRLDKGTLDGPQAATDISGYLALASLRLDSEWKMRLTDPAAKDLPPLTMVLAGPLERAPTIAPQIGTKAIESYFTVHRMQEDVERLENLDVTGGRKPPQPQNNPAPPPQRPDRGAAVAPSDAPPPIPERSPFGEGWTDPTAAMTGENGQEELAPPPPAPVRRRRPEPARDDWKRGIPIFGGRG